ncbi:MAG: helix-turn-helix domain-containing protein [Hyphomicrobium sp.]|jgi:hypothetical protein
MTTGHFLPVKHFNSAAELLAEARARRARLFQPTPPRIAKPLAPPAQAEPARVIMRLPEVIPGPPEPRAHVDAYRAHMRLKIMPLKHMIKQVCRDRRWDASKVLGKSRRYECVERRQELMWLAKEMFPGKSLKEIGNALGGLDHTTVLYGIRQHEKRRNEGLK